MRKLFPPATRLGDIAAAILLAILLSLFLIARADAQQRICMSYLQFSEKLVQAHQTLIGVGVVGNTHMILFWSRPGGEHWTILSVDTQGVACVLAAGADWDQGRIPAIGERSA